MKVECEGWHLRLRCKRDEHEHARGDGGDECTHGEGEQGGMRAQLVTYSLLVNPLLLVTHSLLVTDSLSVTD